MAAPFLAAAVAVLRSADADIDGEQAVQTLIDTAEDSGERGWDRYFGYGRADVLAALDVIAPAPEVEEQPAATDDPSGFRAWGGGYL